uniref:Uncharacterized protein n=1 Tax=Siphoviridae sp. ctTfn5 TaxID=2827878 RepID=A0A8S5THW6_9CAUD|nr:MAG TPA: hypothetical protein [Siphoviridae sp. ctTfn5]
MQLLVCSVEGEFQAPPFLLFVLLLLMLVQLRIL